METQIVNPDKSISYVKDFTSPFNINNQPQPGESVVDFKGVLWVENKNNQLLVLTRESSEWELSHETWESMLTRNATVYGLCSWILPIVPEYIFEPNMP